MSPVKLQLLGNEGAGFPGALGFSSDLTLRGDAIPRVTSRAVARLR